MGLKPESLAQLLGGGLGAFLGSMNQAEQAGDINFKRRETNWAQGSAHEQIPARSDPVPGCDGV